MTNRGSLDLALVMAKGSLPRTTTRLRTTSPGLTDPMNRASGLMEIDGVTRPSTVTGILVFRYPSVTNITWSLMYPGGASALSRIANGYPQRPNTRSKGPRSAEM